MSRFGSFYQDPDNLYHFEKFNSFLNGELKELFLVKQKVDGFSQKLRDVLKKQEKQEEEILKNSLYVKK